MTWDARLIGRENELKTLSYGLEQIQTGHGSILFINGEAGVGKTRLVEELTKQKTSFDFETLTGRCIYREGTDPYLPFIEMFKGYLSVHPYLAKTILSSFMSPAEVIFDIYPSEKSKYSPRSVESEKNNTDENNTSIKTSNLEIVHDIQLLEGKHRMFETVSKIIINISQKKPLVMFLDDLQWADSASLHLLHYLARNITDQRILILGAYRPEDLDFPKEYVHPLQELITRLGSENLFSILELDRLNLDATTQIVNDLLEVEKVPNDFAELINSESEGNPFFIKEILKTLIDGGALSIERDQLVLNISPEEIVIPTSIKELINLRLQRLDDECVEVLEYASVVGNEFNFELLKNIIEIKDSKLIKVLNKLTEAKFIIDQKGYEGFTWKFTHNKTHEVIYNGIKENIKKIIHLRIAKYLEDVKIDNIDDVVYDLSYHFYHGFDFDRALSYSIEGGEKAIKSYANKDALNLYNISLKSLRRLDEKLANTNHYKEKKIEVLSKLGILNKTIGEWDKAIDYYEQTIPICDEIKAPQKRSKIYLYLGWIYQQRSCWHEAQNYFRKSLSMAQVIQDSFISAEAYHGLGAVYEREGELENALECYSTSHKFAEENYDSLNLAKAHNAFGRVYNLQGNYSKAVEHKKKSIVLFDKIHDLPELAKAYTSLAITFYDMGELEKNIEFNEKCIELADQISDIRIKGYGLSNTVEALVKSSQLEKAIDYASNALEIFKKLEERFMISLSHMNFGMIFHHKKEWSKSKYYFKNAIGFMENLNIPYHLADCYRQFADMYRSKNEPTKVKYYLEKSREIYLSIAAANYVKQIDEELNKVSLIR